MGLISRITGNDIRGALLLAAGALELIAAASGFVSHDLRTTPLAKPAHRCAHRAAVGAVCLAAVAAAMSRAPVAVASLVAISAVFVAFTGAVLGMIITVAAAIISPVFRARWDASANAERERALEARRNRAQAWADNHGIDIRSDDDLDRIISHDTDFAREHGISDHEWSSISSSSSSDTFGSGISSSACDIGINPASGLPCIGGIDGVGGIDTAGNPWGTGTFD